MASSTLGILRQYELDKVDDFNFKDFQKWMKQTLTIEKVKDYTYSTLPRLFSPAAIISKFFSANLLKKRVLNAPYFPFLKSCIESQIFQETFFLGFWLVFTISFKPHLEDVIQHIVAEMRRLNKSLSLQFFSNPYREELVVVYEFCQGYLVHFGMAEVFNQDSSKVATSRFILNCYHILLFQQRGFLVSDYYLQGKLESIFGMSSFAYLNHQNA